MLFYYFTLEESPVRRNIWIGSLSGKYSPRYDFWKGKIDWKCEGFRGFLPERLGLKLANYLAIESLLVSNPDGFRGKENFALSISEPRSPLRSLPPRVHFP